MKAGTIAGNLFDYCGNNPVKNIDRDGKFFLTAVLVGAGIAVGVKYVSDVYSNYKSGKRGKNMFKLPCTFKTLRTYLATALGGAIAAIPVGGLVAAFGWGALGSAVCDVVNNGIMYSYRNKWTIVKNALTAGLFNGISAKIANSVASAGAKQIQKCALAKNASKNTKLLWVLRKLFPETKPSNITMLLKKGKSLTKVNNKISSTVFVKSGTYASIKAGQMQLVYNVVNIK